MPAPIPLFRPDITQLEVDAVAEAMRALGPAPGLHTEEFEHRCARRAGRRHAVAVNSGAAALHCALLAVGVRPGDQVILSALGCVGSTNAVVQCGARPVFVDVDPTTLNIDPSAIARAITPKTRAIIGTECFGNPAGMLELEQLAQSHELPLVEDACQGFGGLWDQRPVGSFGRLSAVGFETDKPLTCGEGGMVLTDDQRLADACRLLRNQGRTQAGQVEGMGYSYLLGETAAALGAAQLQRIEPILQMRRQAAHEYIHRLMTSRFLILPTVHEQAVMSWFAFVVRLSDLFEPQDRDQVLTALRSEGIGCANYFPPAHLHQHIIASFGYTPGSLPVCEYVSARTLALPLYGGLGRNQVLRICEVLEKTLERIKMGPKSRF